jgi:hypothetical protein
VGTQVGNGLDVTVKYIDDKTGNVASAKWNKLVMNKKSSPLLLSTFA